MDITLITIAILILFAVVFLILFLFKSVNKKSFKADDGSVFDTQADLDIYQDLYKRTKPLFDVNSEEASSNLVLGFQKAFLTKLISDGFPDLKSLIKYRKQFKALSDLINT